MAGAAHPGKATAETQSGRLDAFLANVWLEPTETGGASLVPKPQALADGSWHCAASGGAGG